MALSNECNWTSDICPHHVYNFTNVTEKSKIEGRQSRFLGLILGWILYRCSEPKDR